MGRRAWPASARLPSTLALQVQQAPRLPQSTALCATNLVSPPATHPLLGCVSQAIAEQYFPRLEQPNGIPVTAVDTRGRTYTFKYRFWVNNQVQTGQGCRGVWALVELRSVLQVLAVRCCLTTRMQLRQQNCALWHQPSAQHLLPLRPVAALALQSRMYLMEGAGELHRAFDMSVGDVMVFAQKPDGALVVAGRPATKVRQGQQDGVFSPFTVGLRLMVGRDQAMVMTREAGCFMAAMGFYKPTQEPLQAGWCI